MISIIFFIAARDRINMYISRIERKSDVTIPDISRMYGQFRLKPDIETFYTVHISMSNA